MALAQAAIDEKIAENKKNNRMTDYREQLLPQLVRQIEDIDLPESSITEREKALKEENMKIIVDKFIKILLSNLSAYLPIIQPTTNKGATLRPEFKATSKALSLNLKIIYAETNTSKNLQKELIPPIIHAGTNPIVLIV